MPTSVHFHCGDNDHRRLLGLAVCRSWVAAILARLFGTHFAQDTRAYDIPYDRRIGCTITTADLWSLEIIEVATGKRSEVKSAYCKIFQNNTGWLDPEILRGLP